MGNEDRDFLDDFAGDDDIESNVVEPVEAPEAGEQVEEPEISAETHEQEAEAKAQRDEKGRFKKSENKGVKDDTSEPPSDGKETHVPISVVQKMREEQKELKRQLDAFSAQSQSADKKHQPQTIDPQQDPVRYMQDIAQNNKLDMSEIFARQQFGDESIEKAFGDLRSYMETGDPRAQATYQKVMSARHPYGELVQWHKSHQDVTRLQEAGSLEALIEQEIARRQTAQPKAAQQEIQTHSRPKPNPPPSLARGGSGSTAPEMESEDEFFSGMFKS